MKEFTAHTRDDVVESLPFIKKRFLKYTDFGKASFDKLFTPEELKNSIKYSATQFTSCLPINDGKGKFTMEPLPAVAQYSSLNGMVTDDFNGDGNLDICINANDFGTDPSNGRYDALNGLILQGNGKGQFAPLSILESGMFISGNGKALVKIKGSDGAYLIAASQNKGPLKLFRSNHHPVIIDLNATDVSAIITFKDGRKQKQEIGYGSSFLSQSGRFLSVGSNVASVEIKDVNGKSRFTSVP